MAAVYRATIVIARVSSLRFLWAQVILYLTMFAILAVTVIARLWSHLAGGEYSGDGLE